VTYPLHLRLDGRRVLVVGGGPVAARRVQGLLKAGADVDVVAPELVVGFPPVPVQRRAFVPSDVDGAWLVLACTGVVDDDVAQVCRQRHIWCARADDAGVSAAWVPAVARLDDVVVSVTAGRDPRRAVGLRDAIGSAVESGGLPLRRHRPSPGSVAMMAAPVLLAVAHGSRDPASQQVVGRLLERAAALRPGLRAEAAYVDNASPSVRTALGALADDGIDDVIVLPLLLTPASHSKTDVAASVQAGRIAHPSMRLRYGRPLGPHPALVEVLARRLDEAGAADDDPVLLVAGGALDPDANAQVAATARHLFEVGAWPSVDIAFASTAAPSVPQALARLQSQGAKRVSVARYFLAPGRLPALVAWEAEQVPGLQIVVSAPLGEAAELTALMLERFDEARATDIRMNCDACLYRVPFRGYELAVGAAQRPHAHPDDRA